MQTIGDESSMAVAMPVTRFVAPGPEVATALGIAETTVRTHLGRVFEKTGTRRQADLVKLAAGFACPLVA